MDLGVIRKEMVFKVMGGYQLTKSGNVDREQKGSKDRGALRLIGEEPVNSRVLKTK